MKNNIKIFLIMPLLMLTGCTSLEKLYLSEIKTELAKHPPSSRDTITEKDIASLPEPVQRYFKYCGYLGKEKMTNARIEWQDFSLRLDPKKDWMNAECYQFNSVPEPTRIVYMESHIWGLFPFEGRDKYQDGHGNMLIKLLKLFTVADDKGKEMDESALVTVLAEALIVPSYALQSYITWTAVDSTSAKATIRFRETEVGGVFYFNQAGENIRFETNDRYQSQKDGSHKKIKWSAVPGNYQEKRGIRFPTSISAIWKTEGGDHEYVRGTISNIEFDVKE
jgi:hypothetical protein